MAQSVPGSSRVTAEEVMEAAATQTPSTVQDMVDDVERTEEEEATQQEQLEQQREREGRQPQLVTGRNLAKILGLLEEAKQIAEDVDPNNDRLLRFLSGINIANSVYEPLHREMAQKSRQALISAYLTRRAPAAVSDTSVEEEALEMHDQ